MSFGARIYKLGSKDMQKLPIVTLMAVGDETTMLTLDLSKVLAVREIETEQPRGYVELLLTLTLPRGDISMTLFLTPKAYNEPTLRRLKTMADVQSKKAS